MRTLAGRLESSHPYVGLSGKALQSAWVPTGQGVFDNLALSCEVRAVDQEAIDIKRFASLAHISLPEALALEPERLDQALD
jgi:hypothetical protein